VIQKSLNELQNDPMTPKTQLVMVVGFWGIAWFLENHWLEYAAIGFGGVFIALPSVGNRIVWLWYRLAYVLSLVVNPVVLGAVYWLFISPIALLFRLFGNDPLQKKAPSQSNYQIRNKTYEAKDLKFPW
jgi:hypothetical protein